MKKKLCIMLGAALSATMLTNAVFATEISVKKGDYVLPGEETTAEELTPGDAERADAPYTIPEETGGNASREEEEPSADNNDGVSSIVTGKHTSDKVIVKLRMLPRMIVKDSFAVLLLCDKNGKVLDEKTEWVGGITENLTYEFSVPKYNLGDSFILKLKGGLTDVKYYENVYGVGADIKLDTYVYTDENGEVVEGNTFDLDASPEFEHAIVVYVEGKQMKLSPRARLMDKVAMVPVRAVAEQLGLEVKYDSKYNSVVCQIGDKQAIFNMGTDYATFFGEDLTLPRKCEIIDKTAFVPARSLAEAFGAKVDAIDFGDHIDVCVGEASLVSEYMMQIPINKWGIDSKTNYLVWIDKSDYRVRVYTGSQYKWKQAASFPCAIGAPSTPTVTGSFEYLYRVSSWDYPGYYVGPCLVFYRGYALHSTLLRYDGVPYDNRVETMISHGCVRLHKSDIDWIAARLPIGSRIYVTE